jgi:hypothetical protein
MSHPTTIPRPREALRVRANEQVQDQDRAILIPPLLPLRTPPDPLTRRYPPLPCPSRDPHFTNEYTVTTHLIPAAFPRASPFVSPVPASPEHESRDERAARVQRYTDELLSLQAQHGPDDSGTQPRVLWSVLNRYVRRKGDGGGLTLVALHANGLHKEVRGVDA